MKRHTSKAREGQRLWWMVDHNQFDDAKAFMYLIGRAKAHYPVPALALEVWRLPKRIVIVQEQMHEGEQFWRELYAFPVR